MAPLRKPPQVLMIRKDEPAPAESAAASAPESPPAPEPPAATAAALAPVRAPARPDDELFDLGAMEGLTMADLLGPDPGRQRQPRRAG
ncbi:MAG: 30S ribosomal protein S1, partial [Synechococcaceae cyanobacterium]|nr:30S ribosomal protein S1 [Synechococcaceae cyanobacterium]